MTIRFHDTRTKELREFVPIEPGVVRMYNCGPTVYNYAHIGNFRSFLLADLLRRFLDWKGFRVRQIMNLTDVGHLTDDEVDKMAVAAGREKKDPLEIANFYADAFFEDASNLGLKKAERYPRATEHVEAMIALARRLEEKGFAYRGGDDLNFEIRKFPSYGQLSGNELDDLIAGARVEVNPNKRDPLDFALWKIDPKHIMRWDSPWGSGFPGWHLECSAMSMQYLGETLDVHTGGEDNIFPHHECEIAQSEAATGKPFVRYWLHARHLLVGGKKMAKSLGNFYTVRDLLAAGFSGRSIRWALMDGHYRQQHNFAVEKTGEATRFTSLEQAAAAIEKIESLLLKVKFASAPGNDPAIPGLLERARREFDAALSEDLNISEARRAVFELVGELNRREVTVGDAPAIRAAFESVDSVLGFLEPEAQLPDDVRRLIEERDEARKKKDWAGSDRLRDRIREKGYSVEDSPKGTVWRKL